MIEYTNYTINGFSYGLTNNGDGTWSRDINAPSATGKYDLLLEIKQNGQSFYIDSSDPRYSFYLEVIDEIESEVKLIEYLPLFLQDILEFQVICNTESIELDAIYNSIDKTLLNAFVQTASVDKITKFEMFLGFKGVGTLEQRKAYILALFRKGKKLSGETIKEITNTITGSDCIVTFFGSDELNNPQPTYPLLQIQVLSPDNNKDYRYDDVLKTIKPLVPGHVKLMVIRFFANWSDVMANFQDWNAVKSSSNWKALRSYIPPQ